VKNNKTELTEQQHENVCLIRLQINAFPALNYKDKCESGMIYVLLTCYLRILCSYRNYHLRLELPGEPPPEYLSLMLSQISTASH
jgi:hypothetical protein